MAENVRWVELIEYRQNLNSLVREDFYYFKCFDRELLRSDCQFSPLTATHFLGVRSR